MAVQQKKFNRGDLVWAKVKGFPPWPAKVTKPKLDDEIKIPTSGTFEYVTFYGSDTYSFVHPDLLWPYEEFKDKYIMKVKIPEGFEDAIGEIEDALKRRKDKAAGGEVEESSSSSEESVKEEPPEEETDDNQTRRHLPRRKSSMAFFQQQQQKKEPEDSESSSIPSSPSESEPTKRRRSSDAQKVAVDKTQFKKIRRSDVVSPERKRKSDGGKDGKMWKDHDSRSEGSYKKSKQTFQIPSPNKSVEKFLSTPKHLSKMKFEFTSSTFLPDVLPRPSQESFKIGFLGLGKMGSMIVRGLLNAGLNVMVWNRTPSKCKTFVELGAEKGSTPAEVVQSCDITISCVTDSRALKDLTSGSNGVLESIVPGKSFVDMSTVDIDIITELNEAILSRGGRFLESPVIGSLDSNEESGQLVVVASGDRSLFDDCCSTCFNAIAKKAFYFGSIGSATCIKLIINMIQGTLLAGLAESLALGEKLGLDQAQMLNILSLLPVSSKLNSLKGDAMITNQLSTRQLSLEHMQRDLRLALSLAEFVEHPLYTTSATNELFKKAKARGYGDHDTAAIYRATD